MVLSNQNSNRSNIGSVKTAVGVIYNFRTLSARVVNVVFDRHEFKQKRAEPPQAQESHKKPLRATSGSQKNSTRHFLENKKDPQLTIRSSPGP